MVYQQLSMISKYFPRQRVSLGVVGKTRQQEMLNKPIYVNNLIAMTGEPSRRVISGGKPTFPARGNAHRSIEHRSRN